jgi:hypothetical protein
MKAITIAIMCMVYENKWLQYENVYDIESIRSGHTLL